MRANEAVAIVIQKIGIQGNIPRVDEIGAFTAFSKMTSVSRSTTRVEIEVELLQSHAQLSGFFQMRSTINKEQYEANDEILKLFCLVALAGPFSGCGS